MKTKLFYKLLLGLICSIFYIQGNAQNVGDTFTSSSGIEYTITSNIGSLKVSATSYEGASFDIEIPSTVTYDTNIYYVTAIGESAFEGNLIERVTIGSYVTTIGQYAFYGNYLSNLTIPASVTSIGEYAFYRGALSNVTSSSESPATLPSNTFSSISSIRLTVPEGSEQNYIDAGWIGFQTVNSRFTVDGVVYELTEVNTNEVTVVDYVGKSKTVDIPSYVEDNGGVSYLVNKIGDRAFFEDRMTSISIPNSVTSIGFGAFLYNNLVSLIIPASIISIGESAFVGNEDLISVTSESESPAYLPNDAFDDNSVITLTIPKDTEKDYINQNWVNFNIIETSLIFTVDNIVYEVINNKEVSAIDYDGTSNTIEIPSIVTHADISYTVITIGKNAFLGNALTNITIPASITTIESYAFAKNGAITEVISLSETPAILLNNTFTDTSLITLTIPAGTLQTYIKFGWTGFASVIEHSTLSTVNVALLNKLTLNTNANTLTVITDTIKIEQIEIYSIIGTKVALGTNNKIAIDHLNIGIYIAKIYTSNGITFKKFVKN